MDRYIRAFQRQLADLSGNPAEDLAPDCTFAELGFDSLFLTQLTQDIQRSFGVKVTFRQLSDSIPTIRGVAEYIAAHLARASR